jgi:hypothetical protein
MCDTMLRVAYSRLGALLLLAPPAPAMRIAVRRATTLSPLGAALQLTLPPAHDTPPGCLHVLPPKPYFSAPFTATTHPLSVLNNPLLHIRHKTVAVREQVRRWVQHVSIQMVNSAWAGDVRWVCSRAGWTGTPPYPPPPGSQAVCAVPYPNPDGGSNTRHSTPLHGVHSTTEGHLGVYLLL